MAQAMIDNKNNYQERIQSLRSHGDILLQRIKKLEIKMNLTKQQNQEPNQQEIDSLNAMVKKLLKMLAQINTYEYFKLTNEPFIFTDNFFFHQMCNSYFEDYIRRFITKLRLKRIRRLQILQHEQSLQRMNNFMQPVDFQIWQ